MKRKNFLMVFSAAFFIALLAVATAPAAASPTNNWGVDEGTTLTYKAEETVNDHSTVYEFEITVVTIADTDADNLDDLFWTGKMKLDGADWGVDDDGISGSDFYTYGAILWPYSTFSLEPILPIDDDGPVPGAQGLDWTAAKTAIEALAPGTYDSVDVTEDGDMFKVEIEDHGSDSWGDWDRAKTVEWDSAKGTLESFTDEYAYEDAGITETIEVTKGSIGGGLPVSTNVIAIAALGLAVLALLMILIKK